MIGSRLAHYEITGHLGSGGMGDVYQASDTRLERSVAIKVLPDAFATDADRVARFEREARVLASLNHPHIAAIYGIEQSGWRTFLVMELAAGETLAARIARGKLPLDEALAIATQLAKALEAAHARGIVHRDLKPANITVDRDNQVQTRFNERDAQFSPDGKWIAYQSDESGRYEIYVQPFGAPGGKTQISTQGGAQVRWRRDGRELFYVGFDERLMAVPIRLDSTAMVVDAGAPVPLFQTRRRSGRRHPHRSTAVRGVRRRAALPDEHGRRASRRSVDRGPELETAAQRGRLKA